MGYQWYDFVGNVGVACILLAFLLLQLERIHSKAVLYGLMNSFGALFIMISLCFDFNLSAFVVEFFWFVISLIGLVRNRFFPNRPASS